MFFIEHGSPFYRHLSLLCVWVTSKFAMVHCEGQMITLHNGFVGTGDHSFERRLRLGGPLLKDNIATMVLERYALTCPVKCNRSL